MRSKARSARTCARRCHGCRRRASWSRSATTATWGRSSNRSNRWPCNRKTPKRLRELYERYEFKVWLREIDNAAVANALNGGAVNGEPPPTQARPDVEYETVLSYEQLEAWLTKIGSADLTSIDTETTSLDPIAAELVGISLSTEVLARVLHPARASLYAGRRNNCRWTTCSSNFDRGSKARINGSLDTT